MQKGQQGEGHTVRYRENAVSSVCLDFPELYD